jgi:hypothetical protein
MFKYNALDQRNNNGASPNKATVFVMKYLIGSNPNMKFTATTATLSATPRPYETYMDP